MERASGMGKQHCPCQCHPDLSWIRFGDSRIHFSDVDAMFVVERRRHFLFIEWKERDERLTDGQRILLEAQSFQPNTTVLLVHGAHGDPETITRVRKGAMDWPEPTDKNAFQKSIDSWFERVNR